MKSEINADWSHVVLVCRKCSKKMGRKFGPDRDERLAKALRRELKAKKGRKSHMGVVEVDCLDVCPKKGAVVIDSRRPKLWRLVDRQSDVAALARELGPGVAAEDQPPA